MNTLPDKPPDRSRRAVILATVGIVVVMGLAVFYVAVVAPIRHTHHALRMGGEHDEFHSDQPIEELGGPERAASRLTDYLRLPNWVASRKAVAAFELGLCGEQGVPCLIDCLSNSDASVRAAAAHGLSLVEPPPQRAVAPLIRLVRDSDAHSRLAMAYFEGWSAAEAAGIRRNANSAIATFPLTRTLSRLAETFNSSPTLPP